MLHGRSEPAPGGGTIFQFESVDLQTACDAFEQFLKNPKEFAIDTEFGRIDFVVTEREDIWIDIWMCGFDISEAVLPVTAAKVLINKIFTEPDKDRWGAFIHAHATSIA